MQEEQDRSAKTVSALYLTFFNYLLKTYTTEDILAEAELALRIFSQLPHHSVSEYLDELWTKTLHMGRLYDDGHIKSFFNEGVLPNLRQLVRAYSGNHKRSELKPLAKYVYMLTALRIPSTGKHKPPKEKDHQGASQAITVGNSNP